MSESGPIDWMQRLVDRWHQAGAPPSELNEAIRIKQEIERLTAENRITERDKQYYIAECRRLNAEMPSAFQAGFVQAAADQKRGHRTAEDVNNMFVDWQRNADNSWPWQSHPPRSEGYYWWRMGDRIEPCKIVNVDDRFLEVWFIGEMDPLDEDQWLSEWQWLPLAPFSSQQSTVSGSPESKGDKHQ